MTLAHLPDRTVLAVTGEDRVAFLQGLVSNDVSHAEPGRAVWAALLTPQGKWLADFFILSDGDRLLLDCESAQAPDLARRLLRYRLRARAAINPTALAVHAAWDDAAPDMPEAVIAPDPRLPEAGWRVLAAAPLAPADAGAWDTHRLCLGLPDGSRDMEPEKSVLLEAGFDELSGVSWTKGCYMGQELTARTRYRGLLKRRLVPVAAPGHTLPPAGTPILRGQAEAGLMRSSRDGLGLALLRLDALHEPLQCGGLGLTPQIPAWMRLPEPAT
jgi:folate-binding protein YgfZ